MCLFSCLQPCVHESRHFHAIRRPRGCGGLFLNAKNKNGDRKEEAGEEATSDERTLLKQVPASGPINQPWLLMVDFSKVHAQPQI
ncbi:hypothetical protein Bca4012_001931 [Brassica carinata]